MATAHILDFPDAGQQGITYGDLNGDYEAYIKTIEDYDKPPPDGKGPGWKWTFIVKGLSFKESTSFSPAARFKIQQILTALGVPVEEQGTMFDPNTAICQKVGVSIGLDENGKTDILKYFPLVKYLSISVFPTPISRGGALRNT